MTGAKAEKTKNSSTSKASDKPGVAKQKLITINIMGKPHKVPADATIMGAIEYAGHQIIRGAGCREGYCGACATIYRLPGDYKIQTGLACMTMVEEGMSLAQVPYVPGEKAIYDIEKLKPNVTAIQEMYPSVFRCVACNTCTKSCPQGLQVMDYVQAAKRGDIAMVMDLSFDCVVCGLCMLRCPAEITQPLVGIMAKRLYGRYLRKDSPELALRVKAVEEGAYNAEYAELMSMKREALSKLYYARDSE
ncbi:MAG: 4Fe-4S dicluster domain-containing protein [Nitrosomonadales bacterium]|nr:4Fe-4S dicluster domain-containing protein [Nitrosomonadales bacterium]